MLTKSLFALLATYSTGCATMNCDAEAKEAVPAGDERAFADAKAKCDKRMDEAQRALKKEREQREAQERRDAFRNRNDGRPR